MTDARATGSWLVADEIDEEESPPQAEPKPVQREVVPGFYAGSSKGAPPPMRNTRKAIVAVGGAAVAVVVLGGAVLALGGDDAADQGEPSTAPAADDEPAGTDGSSGPGNEPGAVDDAAPPDSTPAAAPADPGADTGDAPSGDGDGDGEGDGADPANAAPARASAAVQVADQGWYVGDGMGSYGFTVENTSDQVLGSFAVVATAYDEGGEVISGPDAWRHVVGTLQPYQRLVVTDLLHSEAQAANGIGRMEFEVQELTASEPGVRSPNDVPPGHVAVGEVERTENLVRTTVSYRVASTYEVALDANVYLVFRNAGGDIVGGARSFIDLPATGSVAGDFNLPTLLVSPDATDVEVHVAPQLPL